MGVRIKTGDTVKIISGADKGKTGKVTKVLPAENKVFIEGIGNRERHMRPNMYRRGGKKEIQVGIDASKLLSLSIRKLEQLAASVMQRMTKAKPFASLVKQITGRLSNG